MKERPEGVSYSPFSILPPDMVAQGWHSHTTVEDKDKIVLTPPETCQLTSREIQSSSFKDWHVVVFAAETQLIVPSDSINFGNFSLSSYKSQPNFEDTALGI